MRACQVCIAILFAMAPSAPGIAGAVTTTVGICAGTPPAKTDPPLSYAPDAGNPQNCVPLTTEVRGEKVCSDDAPGVVCLQRIVQLPMQTFFYTYSPTSRLCEQTARTYFGVAEADNCINPRAGHTDDREDRLNDRQP